MEEILWGDKGYIAKRVVFVCSQCASSSEEAAALLKRQYYMG
jgi:hypothetical protein